MTMLARTSTAGGAVRPTTVEVWDPFVRIFHWTLVLLVATALATGDDFERLHIAVGYGIAGLIAARVLWGFAGSRHARFADFVRPPRAVLRYLSEVIGGRARRYTGHNPAGGMMIIALLAVLGGLAVTGWMMTTDAFWGSKWVEETHEALASALIGLVVLHVLGVAVTSLAHGDNLVKAMITGRKPSGRP